MRAFLGIPLALALSCDTSTLELGHNPPAPAGTVTPPSPPLDAGPQDAAPPATGLEADAAPNPSWAWVNPQPTGSTLRAIWGVGSDDVWAVGTGSTVLHWDGESWRSAYAGTLDDDFYAVYSGGAGDAWIAGRDVGGHGVLLRRHDGAWSPDDALGGRLPYALGGTGPNDVWLVLDGGDVARFDGAGWAFTQAPAGPGALRDVWGASADDIWTVGDGGRLAHFDGRAWTRLVAPGITDPDKDFIGAWGSAHDDVWLVYQTASPSAEKQGRTGFIHWDGASLRLVQEASSTCPWTGTGKFGSGVFDAHHSDASARFEPQDAPYRRGHRVWGTRSDSVLAVAGIDQCPWYWDGKSWSIDAVPQLAQNEPYEREGPALWGDVPGGLWLVGAGGRLMRHDASAPVVDRTRDPGTPQTRYTDVFADYREPLLHVAVVPGGAWATSASRVLFFGPAGWTAVGDLYLGAPTFNALAVLSNADVWVGANTSLHHWNGATWTDVPLPESASTLDYYRSIYGVWASGPNDVWVARGLDLLHFDGSAWTAIARPRFTPAEDGEGVPLFTGVAGTGSRDVWAAAAAYDAPRSEQILYHFDGTALTESHRSWLAEAAPHPSVWARAADDAWVTTSPTLHWDGATWSAVGAMGDGTVTTAAWGRAAGDTWLLAMSTSSAPQPFTRILHWDGSTARMSFESRLVLSAISGDATGAWAVGDDGATVRLVAPATPTR